MKFVAINEVAAAFERPTDTEAKPDASALLRALLDVTSWKKMVHFLRLFAEYGMACDRSMSDIRSDIESWNQDIDREISREENDSNNSEKKLSEQFVDYYLHQIEASFDWLLAESERSPYYPESLIGFFDFRDNPEAALQEAYERVEKPPLSYGLSGNLERFINNDDSIDLLDRLFIYDCDDDVAFIEFEDILRLRRILIAVMQCAAIADDEENSDGLFEVECSKTACHITLPFLPADVEPYMNHFPSVPSQIMSISDTVCYTEERIKNDTEVYATWISADVSEGTITPDIAHDMRRMFCAAFACTMLFLSDGIEYINSRHKFIKDNPKEWYFTLDHGIELKPVGDDFYLNDFDPVIFKYIKGLVTGRNIALCPICGMPVDTSKQRGSDAVYCSNSHKTMAKNRRRDSAIAMCAAGIPVEDAIKSIGEQYADSIRKWYRESPRKPAD